jgi:hypothetical protein
LSTKGQHDTSRPLKPLCWWWYNQFRLHDIKMMRLLFRNELDRIMKKIDLPQYEALHKRFTTGTDNNLENHSWQSIYVAVFDPGKPPSTIFVVHKLR